MTAGAPDIDPDIPVPGRVYTREEIDRQIQAGIRRWLDRWHAQNDPKPPAPDSPPDRP
jgi:hypothetical protein